MSHCHEGVVDGEVCERRAKPDGLVYIPFEAMATHLRDAAVSVLPGVGEAMEAQLQALGVTSCADLLQFPRVVVMISLNVQDALEAAVGPKTSQTLQQYARGEDGRVLCVAAASQSVSTQVSYGVRCATVHDVAEYMKNVCSVGQEKGDEL